MVSNLISLFVARSNSGYGHFAGSSAFALHGSIRSTTSPLKRNRMIDGTYFKRWTPSNLEKLRSKVATGKCPAFFAISSTRQSEKSTSDRPR